MVNLLRTALLWKLRCSDCSVFCLFDMCPLDDSHRLSWCRLLSTEVIRGKCTAPTAKVSQSHTVYLFEP